MSIPVPSKRMLGFYKSRREETIFDRCYLLQLSLQSLGTSIVELHVSRRSKELGMPKLLTATAYVSLSCCTIALAQTNVSPGQQTAESAHHIPKAPVAHPRPTPRDISAAKEVDDN